MGGMSNPRWKGSLGLTWGGTWDRLLLPCHLGWWDVALEKAVLQNGCSGLGWVSWLGVFCGSDTACSFGVDCRRLWSACADVSPWRNCSLRFSTSLFVAAFVRWTPSGSIYPSFTDPSCKWNVGPLSMNSTFRSSHNTLKPAFRALMRSMTVPALMRGQTLDTATEMDVSHSSGTDSWNLFSSKRRVYNINTMFCWPDNARSRAPAVKVLILFPRKIPTLAQFTWSAIKIGF